MARRRRKRENGFPRNLARAVELLHMPHKAAGVGQRKGMVCSQDSSSQRTASPAAQGGRGRQENKGNIAPPSLLAGELLYLPHKAAGVEEREWFVRGILLATELLHLPHKAAGVEEKDE